MTGTERRLSDQVEVSGQLEIGDLGLLAHRGISVILNHRPDGEEPDQIDSRHLADAAESAGIRYHHIPVTGFPEAAAVEETRRVLEALKPGERALFFCRSGMRSTAAWALAERLRGVDADALRAAARQAGYDLDRLPL